MPILTVIPVQAKPSRMTFLGIAYGQGLMLWEGGFGLGYTWDSEGTLNWEQELPESTIVFDTGFFITAGKGLLKEPRFEGPPMGLETWELKNVKSLSLMSVNWADTLEHELQVTFQITHETLCIYNKGLMQELMTEILWVGMARENPLPPEDPNFNPLDPKFATMTFEGTHDGERIEGNANVIFFYNEQNEGNIFVNLWIDEETYAGFFWTSQIWDPPPLPAATVLTFVSY